VDKALERTHAQRVLRGLAKSLSPLDFARTKPTFFTRPRGVIVEFIHLHKFRADPSFRVHLGLRVAADTFPAAHLNGPDSHLYVCEGAPGGRKYNFVFHDDPSTVDRCVAELSAFVGTIAEPWFQLWREPSTLLVSPDSPLSADEKQALAAARKGGTAGASSGVTEKVLGLA
jgi:hypothetical protein